ncbi:MAG TPA: DUF945 family protein [Lamprocystis sp. (in: g-proteobacteria)]|nr:DUF945 family protein [Lamprocystis sp. (in: g-proteobacteria)]
MATLSWNLQALASTRRTQALLGLIGLTLATRTLPRLLAAGPTIALDPLRFDTPDGPVHLRLCIGMPKPGTGIPHPAMDAVGRLSAVAGDGEIELPEATALDWLARSGQETPATALPDGAFAPSETFGSCQRPATE